MAAEATSHENDENKIGISTRPLAEYSLQCEGLCDMKYDPSKVYFCQHNDCDNSNNKMLCAECGNLSHRRKKHSFIANTQSVQQILVPDQKKYKYGKETAAALVKHAEKMQKIIWNQRWHGVESTGTLMISFGVCVGKSTVEFARQSTICYGQECVKSITGNAPIGSVIATGLEWAYIWYRYQDNQISRREAIALAGTSAAATFASTYAAFTLSSATDTLIAAGKLNPYMAIGITVIGAIIVGVCVRSVVDCSWQKWLGKKQDDRTALQKEALKYFFGNENYDIDDDKKFNEKLLKRTYRRMALIAHPDAKDGNHEEWLKLSSYYGILTSICEYKIQERGSNILLESDDVNAEQKSGGDEKPASLPMSKELSNTKSHSTDIDIPEKYICPITHQIMYDPVVAFDGFCYERNAIENYLKVNKKSPQTGVEAPYLIVFPNHQCKANINKFIKANNIMLPKHNGQYQKGGNETDNV